MVAVFRTDGCTHRDDRENSADTKYSNGRSQSKSRVGGLRTRAKRNPPTRSISTEHRRYQTERYSARLWILFARLKYCGISGQLSYHRVSQISVRRSSY